MTRTTTPTPTHTSLLALWTLSLSLSFGSAALFAARADAAEPCAIAVKGDSPTARACTKGGRAEAKKVMKEMVKAAKGKGSFTCEGCHKDLGTFELTPNAVEDYKKLQAASGVK